MKVSTGAVERLKQDNPYKDSWFCMWWPQTIALSLPLITDCSLVLCSVSVLVTTGSMGISICSFVLEGTGEALPEPYKLTSSRLLVCMFRPNSQKNTPLVWHESPISSYWDMCSQPSTMQLDEHLQENTRIGR